MSLRSEGCSFQDHCPLVTELCRKRAPVLVDIPERRLVRCHQYGLAASYEQSSDSQGSAT